MRMVETHLLSCGNRFLLFNIFFNKWKPPLKLVETHYFVVKTLFPTTERLFGASFLQVKTVTETSQNK